MAVTQVECSCGEAHELDEDDVGAWVRCRCGRIVRARGAKESGVYTQRRVDRWAVRLTWAYLALAVVAWLVLWTLSDRWWPATLFLFGPRWLLLLPLVILIPAAVRYRHSLLAVLAAATVIVLGPVMGMRLGWASWFGSDGQAPELRVVTLNAGASNSIGLELPFRLREWNADILLLQECGDALRADVERLTGWHHRAAAQLCVVSRYPIVDATTTRWDDLRPAREAGIGGSGRAAQYTIEMPGRPIRVVNVHLETAREGLQGVFELDFQRVAENMLIRAMESKRTREWIGRAEGSIVVAGDFNMPVEGGIYRQYWSEFRNAYSDAGTGFGMTKDNGWIQVRIDHVLTGSDWRARKVVVGPVVGLDHRPVIADLAWVGGGGSGVPASSR